MFSIPLYVVLSFYPFPSPPHKQQRTTRISVPILIPHAVPLRSGLYSYFCRNLWKRMNWDSIPNKSNKRYFQTASRIPVVEPLDLYYYESPLPQSLPLPRLPWGPFHHPRLCPTLKAAFEIFIFISSVSCQLIFMCNRSKTCHIFKMNLCYRSYFDSRILQIFRIKTVFEIYFIYIQV